MVKELTSNILRDLRRNWFLGLPLAVILYVIARYGLRCVDDGYYYLQIAYNIAHGHGTTFDGIHATNGYEPLWEFVLVPVFWIFRSKLIAAYAATLLEVVLFLSTGILLSRLISQLVPTNKSGWLIVFLWAFNPIIVNVVSWNGMETALLGFLIVWTLVAFNEYLAGNGSALRLGILATLCALARLDAVFLGLILGAQLILMKKPRKDILALALPFFGALGLYVLSNVYFFGHPGPVSAFYYTMGGQERLAALVLHGDGQFFRFFFNNLAALLSLSGRLPLALSVIVSATAIAVVYLLYVNVTTGSRRILGTLLWYCALLVTSYAALYDDMASTYTYYWLPLFLTGIVIVSLIPPVVKSVSLRNAVVAVAVMIEIAVGIPYAIDLSSLSGYFEVPQKATAFAASHLPKNARIGSWDAGYMGYFSGLTVINLDGLVNNYSFLDTLRSGHLADYIEGERIQYLANVNHPESRRSWIEDNFNIETVYDDTTNFSRFGTRFSLHREIVENRTSLSGIQEFFIYRLAGRKHDNP